MGPQIIHLPDGQNITVTPVFAGLFFKSNDLSTHQNAFPPGWTIVIHTEDGDEDNKPAVADATDENKPHIHSFTKPTLQHDSLFISSISNPSSIDFKPAASPTRQIAMMLWVTLYWYFHQPAPSNILKTEASKHTPKPGKPKGEWRVRIKRDGVLRGRNLIPKLERMGLISSLDSAVGTTLHDSDEAWAHMFVSQRLFWQIPGRLFLFTLQPNAKNARSYPGSPAATPPPVTLTSVPSFPIGPFFSTSHLPTYYPPAPLQYTFSNQVRHPVRPKPPRMGEVFYTRFVPSVGQYLSFRVASVSPKPVPYMGPASSKPPPYPHLLNLTDTALLQLWHVNTRVTAFWGQYIPEFLPNALKSRHSFPVIGMWDGVPFGYFELYWVKEDILGQYLGSAADDWDRGCHVLIGEEWARGRVPSWLTSLVHWALGADYRTMSVCMEPRVDNARFIQHLEYAGFSKEKEISFPHKQAWFGRLRRENWESPAL
ncbi:acyl-CoA N-acyltransferase [Lasiosphaeris hirsuta]|uniref:Acyl-CoA N-acyltransferase n=1 Tax=Lasiosphaeris hirsuta TaxID=260670 RepID=A0AA40E5F8_9PEZI|nr:acyl-CoA N-acyltransferase [Lasiosphaeris hirsuta]